MKRIILSLILLLSLTSLFANIAFSGGYSEISLRDGMEILTLSDNAQVDVEGLRIEADKIVLFGDNYSKVECSGKILITDEEKGLEIKTSKLFYDRTNERLLISAWCEISDTINQLVANALSISFDMKNEKLDLEMQVNLHKITDDGVLSVSATKVSYDRLKESLLLQGNAKVNWNNDNYEAEVIRINLKTNEINLEGGIKGVVNG